MPNLLDVIEDAVGKKKGHGLIFCDGAHDCQEWIHRQCAGLSKGAFQAVSTSDDLFHCLHCLIHQQSKELAVLKRAVKSLSDELSSLKIQVSTLWESSNGNPVIPSSEGTRSTSLNSTGPTSKVNASDVGVFGSPASQLTGKSARSVTQGLSDRKFNLVFFGIPESLLILLITIG